MKNKFADVNDRFILRNINSPEGTPKPGENNFNNM